MKLAYVDHIQFIIVCLIVLKFAYKPICRWINKIKIKCNKNCLCKLLKRKNKEMYDINTFYDDVNIIMFTENKKYLLSYDKVWKTYRKHIYNEYMMSISNGYKYIIKQVMHQNA